MRSCVLPDVASRPQVPAYASRHPVQWYPAVFGVVFVCARMCGDGGGFENLACYSTSLDLSTHYLYGNERGDAA